MRNIDFYQDHLNRVSRSFAFCIEELRDDLREPIALAYILCRVVDTVEDSLWPDKTKQMEAFEKFSEFLTDRASLEGISKWRVSFPDSIPETEFILLNSCERFFSDFHLLPAPTKNALSRSILNMTRGMRHFCKRQLESEKGLSLQSLNETNLYCFFVAGVVGELLTELVYGKERISQDSETLARSAHFGLFLQKINLLKDQNKDQEEGRFLVPNREVMTESLWVHARAAMDYLHSIPDSRVDYKIFCAWSLFLGLLSFPYIEKSWQEKKVLKISRTQMFLELKKIKSRILDQDWLEQKFKGLVPAGENEAVQHPILPAELTGLYLGPLHHHTMSSTYRETALNG